MANRTRVDPSKPGAWVHSDCDGIEAGEVLPDDALVCRGGECTAERFANGSGVTTRSDGTLHGVSTQSAPGATVEELPRPFRNRQVGGTTAGEIRLAGGQVVPSGHSDNPNHATVSGVTADTAERLFTPTRMNPVEDEPSAKRSARAMMPRAVRGRHGSSAH